MFLVCLGQAEPMKEYPKAQPMLRLISGWSTHHPRLKRSRRRRGKLRDRRAKYTPCALTVDGPALVMGLSFDGSASTRGRRRKLLFENKVLRVDFYAQLRHN